MSKSVATESNEGNNSRKTGVKRGSRDEGGEEEEGILEDPPAESLPISTTVSTAPPTLITKLRKPELRAELDDWFVKYERKDNKSVLVELLRLRLRCEILLSGNNFLNTNDFRRLLVPFISDDKLMVMRAVSKTWLAVATGVIDDGVESGAIIVHGGSDMSFEVAEDREERRKLITRVIFLLYVTKIGVHACSWAANLVVVDIPEGVESIGRAAFWECHSLITVSFPTTLTSIGIYAFQSCKSLENVGLLHTNLQELGQSAFLGCSELKSVTVPDSLQTLGFGVFMHCFKLVPSNIDATNSNDAVVAHLRSLQN